MRIWAKAMTGDKITKDSVCEKVGKPTKGLMAEILRTLCETMDIPCPLILHSHYHNFATFSTTKFLPSDFVESVDFERLVLEDISEKK